MLLVNLTMPKLKAQDPAKEEEEDEVKQMLQPCHFDKENNQIENIERAFVHRHNDNYSALQTYINESSYETDLVYNPAHDLADWVRTRKEDEFQKDLHKYLKDNIYEGGCSLTQQPNYYTDGSVMNVARIAY